MSGSGGRDEGRGRERPDLDSHGCRWRGREGRVGSEQRKDLRSVRKVERAVVCLSDGVTWREKEGGVKVLWERYVCTLGARKQ